MPRIWEIDYPVLADANKKAAQTCKNQEMREGKSKIPKQTFVFLKSYKVSTTKALQKQKHFSPAIRCSGRCASVDCLIPGTRLVRALASAKRV